jgi:hypothetical protein
MRNTFSQAIKIIFNPETIVPFLIGSVFLAVFGNAIYDIFKNIFGSTTSDLIKIAVISLLILAIAVGLVASVISQQVSRLSSNVPIEVQQKALDRQYPGLILLVSRIEACQTAIQFHGKTLQHCWLICSPQTLEQAQTIRQQFSKVCIDQPIVINDIYNPLEFRTQINAIYQTRLPKDLPASEVITDYTGMTAHASVGAVLACLGTTRPLQYTPAKVDGQGKIIGSLNPIRIRLRRETQGK